jgi:hypothetical protein
MCWSRIHLVFLKQRPVIRNPQRVLNIAQDLPEIGVEEIIEVDVVDAVVFPEVFSLFGRRLARLIAPARFERSIEGIIGKAYFPQGIYRKTIGILDIGRGVLKHAAQQVVLLKHIYTLRIVDAWPEAGGKTHKIVFRKYTLVGQDAAIVDETHDGNDLRVGLQADAYTKYRPDLSGF